MMWQVVINRKARKQLERLPENIQTIFFLMMKEIEVSGPIRINWPNYGKLKGRKDQFHCHIKKGKPTYVVCWGIIDKKIKISPNLKLLKISRLFAVISIVNVMTVINVLNDHCCNFLIN